MLKLDPTSFRTMPWKNGGGTTTEVLTLPAGCNLDTFEARVSFAHVATDGPFSRFDGVDRTLVLTSGSGMTLHMADGASVFLDNRSRPFVFTGDAPCEATLNAGPVTDLNVMTRRAALRHRAERVALDGDRVVFCPGELTVVVVLAGSLVATDETGDLALSRGDVLTLAPSAPLVTLRGGPATEVLVIDLTRG